MPRAICATTQAHDGLVNGCNVRGVYGERAAVPALRSCPRVATSCAQVVAQAVRTYHDVCARLSTKRPRCSGKPYGHAGCVTMAMGCIQCGAAHGAR